MPRHVLQRGSFSATMAALEAVQLGDQQQILAAMAVLDEFPAKDILGSIAELFSRITPALKPEQKQMMREELDATNAPPAIKDAVVEIGNALMVEFDAIAMAQALRPMVEQGYLVEVLGSIIFAAGRILRRLDAKMHWKRSMLQKW